MNLWKTAGCFKTGRPRGDSDIPFRGGQAGKACFKKKATAQVFIRSMQRMWCVRPRRSVRRTDGHAPRRCAGRYAASDPDTQS